MKHGKTYEELVAEIAHLRERIAYLERQLYGSKSDRRMQPVQDDGPGLFDDFFKEAQELKEELIEQTKEEIKKEAEARRNKERKKPRRPALYHYHGLEERTTTVMPEGVDPSECDIIGKDITRILHREPAKVWVEVIERPFSAKRQTRMPPTHTSFRQPLPPPSSAATTLAQTCSHKS